MNKKILAAAVAAAMVAPAAAFANDVTIYGIAHISVDYNDDGTDAWDGVDVVSRASRLGFKGTEDLANGLKAIWKMEFQVDMADAGSFNPTNAGQGNSTGKVQTGDALWSARNAYVGLAGGWGTFLVGRHDTPFKMSTGKLDLFSDQFADYNSMIGFVDIRTGSAIAYVSPNWAGFSFAAAAVAPHVYSADGDGNEYDSDGIADAYSLAATYDNAGFFATVAYEVLTEDWLEAWASQAAAGTAYSFDGVTTIPTSCAANPAGGFDCAVTGDVASKTVNANTSGLDDDEKWRFGLGWTGAGFTLGGIYEMHDNVLGSDADVDRWQIQAGYTFGNNMVKAMYGQEDWDNDVIDDVDSWAVGLDHNFSKRTTVYMQYGDRDVDGDVDALDRSGFSVGMIHKF